MATVPRITAVSYPDTVPFVYGLQHGGDFRAELVLSDFPTAATDFSARRADIALVPAHVVPTLADARIVTGYCVGYAGRSAVDRLLAEDPETPVRPLFEGPEAPLRPLLEEKKPWPCALWVAHADTDPDWCEELQHALTFGLEHIYEAILAAECGRRAGDLYARLTEIDYIFDNRKEKALEKFWRSGLKQTLRANPG